MSHEGESLGKAHLDLTANFAEFEKGIDSSHRKADQMQGALDALGSVADMAAEQLHRISMKATQAAETKGVSDSMKRELAGIGAEAERARADIERVKISAAQATESVAAGERIKHNVKDIGDEADRSRRKLEEMKISGAGGGGGGFGMPGLMGLGIGAGVLTAPAAGPAALGLLAMLPTVLAGAIGGAGTLALAFQGVGKAISGDKKAFDDLGPSAQQFVLTVRSLDGWLDKLKETAASNLFPGLTAGLKAALSPGTVAAISDAVAALARALGQAGAAWGKYFGSAEFQQILGPLMQAGARNIGLLSDSALHLFDALGVLARAAIPLTSWMTTAIDNGARLVDNWMHAKDATGGLSHAMTEAQRSLQLVWNLFTSLVKAVGALGGALYPVSKIAVKDLTDGLNALAGIIDRNKQTIRDIVGGALSALVATVKVLAPIVGALAKGLDGVAHAIGGWRVAFELIIGGLLATKFLTLADSVATFTTGLSAARLGILALSAPEVLAALALLGVAWYDAFGGGKETNQSKATNGGGNGQIFKRGGKWYETLSGGRGQITQQISAADAAALGGATNTSGMSNDPLHDAGSHSTTSGMTAGRAKMIAFAKQALGSPYLWGGSGPNAFDCSGLVMWAFANGMNVSLPHSTYDQAVMGAQVNPSKAAVGDVVFTNYGEGGKAGPGHEGLIVGYKNGQPIIEAAPHTGAKVQDYYGYGAFTGGKQYTVRDVLASANADYSPFGTDPPWSKNTGQMTAKQKAAAAARHLAARLQIPVIQDQGLARHYAALAASATTGPMIEKYLDDEIGALKRENVDLGKSMQGKSAVQKARIRSQIQKNVDEISKLHGQVVEAVKMAADASAFSKFKTSMASLQSRFQADSAYASVLTGAAAEKYSAVLLGDLTSQRKSLEAEQTKLQSELRTATGKRKAQLQSELSNVQSSLAAVNDQVLQSLEGTVQTMQSHVSTYFSQVTSELDAQFEAQTQAMIDKLGVQFFQNGAQTPLEAQLSAMQQADQLQSLQDAISQATDAKSKAAAERQLQEYQLGIQATAERTRADQDYAAAVKHLQAQRSALESAMNAALAKLGDAFLNGTGSMSDLTAVATEYGLTITQDTIPDFGNLSGATIDLGKAFEDLAAYIEKITGDSPSGSSAGNSGSYTITSGFGTGPGAGRGGHLPSPDSMRIPGLGVSVPAFVAASAVQLAAAVAASPKTTGGSRDLVLEVDGKEISRTAFDSMDNETGRLAVRKLVPHLKHAI